MLTSVLQKRQVLGHAGLELVGLLPPSLLLLQAPWNVFWEAKGGRTNLLLEDLGPLSQDTSAAHCET